MTCAPLPAPPVRFQQTQSSTVPSASDRSLDATVLEHPGPLRGREVRVEHEPGALPARGAGGPASASSRTAPRGPAVLPDDRPVAGPAGGAVPGDRGLALVGDPDRRDAERASVQLRRRARLAWLRRGPRSRSRRARRGRERGSTGAAHDGSWPRRSQVSSTASARTPEVPASIAITTATAAR